MIRIVKTPQARLVDYKNMTALRQGGLLRQKQPARNQDKLVS
jgi:hypothetical protein